MKKKKYEFLDGTPVELTDDEAIKTGFCPGCGWFVGGIESEDRSLHKWGFCSQCLEELRDEMGESDEFDESYWGDE